MNAWNGVSSDTYILQIMVQQELEKVTMIFQENLSSKTIKKNFHQKQRFSQNWKINVISISAFDYEKETRYSMKVSENTVRRYVDLLLIGGDSKKHNVIIKDFYLWSYTTSWKKKIFLTLQTFTTTKMLKGHNNWLL